MKKLLAIVDYQNDFIDGVLGFSGAERFYPRILALIKEYDEANDIVVFIKDTHDENYLHTEEGRHLPTPHCLKGSVGEKMYGDLERISEGHEVFFKDGDTFGSKKFFEYLTKRRDEIGSIHLVGLDLSISVLANAVLSKTACPNARIAVDLSASGDENPEVAQHAVEELKRLQIEAGDFSKERKGII